jgi:phenylalanyl-tRNA synthetase alpha chain
MNGVFIGFGITYPNLLDQQIFNHNSLIKEMTDITDSLSPIERKIVPYLNDSIEDMGEKSQLDRTSVLRALGFLENKGLVEIKTDKKTVVDLDVNGIHYKKNHLPERQLLSVLETKKYFPLEEAKKASKLSDNEFKVSLGVLKGKALIDLQNGKIVLKASREELVKKFPEEKLIEVLPKEMSKLADEEVLAFNNLKKRKNVIQVEEKKIISFKLTSEGKEIAGKKISGDLLEEVTPEVIKSTKAKKFRKYDIQTQVPQIFGGKKHFVNQSIEYGKQIWLDLGFEEMSGSLVQTSFWNFDALFTPQDHPTREMQDTFFLKDVKGRLSDKKVLRMVKDAHEKGVNSSKGWRYQFSTEESKSVVLRTHTTCLSAQTLSNIDTKDLPKKFFAIGKNFRNETVDWSHGFEFNQTEGFVVDKNANFRQLLGYLKEFFKKMGFEKIKFTPAYFPYTEPSVEILTFHPEKKIWLELGGAGIFRPEVTVPLLGENIPVLAWGPGFDRIMMDFYGIKDLRELYANDIKDLRTKRMWTK